MPAIKRQPELSRRSWVSSLCSSARVVWWDSYRLLLTRSGESWPDPAKEYGSSDRVETAGVGGDERVTAAQGANDHEQQDQHGDREQPGQCLGPDDPDELA